MNFQSEDSIFRVVPEDADSGLYFFCTGFQKDDGLPFQ